MHREVTAGTVGNNFSCGGAGAGKISVTAVMPERRVGVTHKVQYSNGELSL